MMPTSSRMWHLVSHEHQPKQQQEQQKEASDGAPQRDGDASTRITEDQAALPVVVTSTGRRGRLFFWSEKTGADANETKRK